MKSKNFRCEHRCICFVFDSVLIVISQKSSNCAVVDCERTFNGKTISRNSVFATNDGQTVRFYCRVTSTQSEGAISQLKWQHNNVEVYNWSTTGEPNGKFRNAWLTQASRAQNDFQTNGMSIEHSVEIPLSAGFSNTSINNLKALFYGALFDEIGSISFDISLYNLFFTCVYKCHYCGARFRFVAGVSYCSGSCGSLRCSSNIFNGCKQDADYVIFRGGSLKTVNVSCSFMSSGFVLFSRWRAGRQVLFSWVTTSTEAVFYDSWLFHSATSSLFADEYNGMVSVNVPTEVFDLGTQSLQFYLSDQQNNLFDSFSFAMCKNQTFSHAIHVHVYITYCNLLAWEINS